MLRGWINPPGGGGMGSAADYLEISVNKATTSHWRAGTYLLHWDAQNMSILTLYCLNPFSVFFRDIVIDSLFSSTD